MVPIARWSYLKDSISRGPLQSIHRKGREVLFLCFHWYTNVKKQGLFEEHSYLELKAHLILHHFLLKTCECFKV